MVHFYNAVALLLMTLFSQRAPTAVLCLINSELLFIARTGCSGGCSFSVHRFTRGADHLVFVDVIGELIATEALLFAYPLVLLPVELVVSQ